MNIPIKEKTNLYSFEASHFEHMLSQNNWTGCWEYLGGVIETLTITASVEAQSFGLKLQQDMADEQKKNYVKEFGALLGELFTYLLTEPSVILSDNSFDKLIYYHETLHTLFYIYDIDNTDDAVMRILGDGKNKLPPSQQKKLLLLLSFDTKLDIVSILKSVDIKYRVPALAAYFARRKIFRENVYNNKIKIYDLRFDLEKPAQSRMPLMFMITGYYLSSYLGSKNKHLVKENINVAMKNFLVEITRERKRIKNSPRDVSRFIIDKSKPTIVVSAELFATNHAMYRCYGDRVKALKNEFNVILALTKDKDDPALHKEFENYVTFAPPSELLQIIHDAQPDIIYLPSVGMRFYGVMLSVMRNAPIQIASLGHPASTMSSEIDYVLGPSDLYDAEAFPKDTYIGDGPARTFIPLMSKENFFSSSESKNGPKKIVKVAVVGSDTKVSYPFFKLLKEIIDSSPFEIHVSFLMGVGGIDSLYIEKYLQENFKNSTYYGWQSYLNYIETIKGIDIVLNPFPFGHTNTIIDTLMCGKPCIGLEGTEPASKTEAHVLSGAGLKEQFIAQDAEDYKKKFFAIAEQILAGNTNFFDRDDVYNKIFTHGDTQDYGKLMRWIYDNHAKLKASGKKYIEMFEEV